MSQEHTTSKPQVIAQRSGLYTIAVALVAGLGGVMFGYDIGVIADAKIGIRQAFGLGDFEIDGLCINTTGGNKFWDSLSSVPIVRDLLISTKRPVPCS